MKKRVKKFKVGFKQIVVEIVTGLLTTLVLSFLSKAGWLPSNVALVINIILIVMNILLAKSMLSWGLFYTFGWLIGTFIFFEMGMLGPWDFVLYFVLPVVVIVVRVTFVIKRAVRI
jgi:hypothetical protein